MRWNWVANDGYAGGSACVLPLVGFDEFALADKITPPVTVVAQHPPRWEPPQPSSFSPGSPGIPHRPAS